MKKIGIFIFLIFSLVGFFSINKENYTFHKEIRENIVTYPDKLPNKEIAKFTSLWFRNLIADFYWLETVQYIGSNAASSKYKKYLFVILDLITELNPYFENPYIIGQLLLPEKVWENTKEINEKNILEWKKLWLKWVKNFCNTKKIKKIFKEDNIQKIRENKEFKNPCKTYTVPYYLAYIYFFYLNDPLTSSNYYKVVSAQDDAPEWAKILAAIMQGKWGNREKSIYMFLNLAENVESKDSVCKIMTKELQDIYYWLKNKQIQLNGKLIYAIEERRKQVFPKFNEEIEDEVLWDTKCTNFLNKAIREINLLYIETGNKEFEKNHPQWLPARNAKALFKEWYIDFLPTDYQQYKDYGIIYEYNYEVWSYDYGMGVYERGKKN